MMRHSLPILLALILAAPLAAQPGAQPEEAWPAPPPPPGGPGRGFGPPPGPPQGEPGFEGVEGTVEIFRVHMMRQALQLSEEQTLEMLDLGEKRRAAMQGIRTREKELRDRMQKLIESPATPDAQFRQALQEAAALRAEEMGTHEKLRKEAEAILTPRQQVQLLFFERRFEEEMRRRIEAVRGRGREGAGPPGAGPRAEQRRQRLEDLKESNPELYEKIIQRQRERQGQGGPPTAAPQ